MKLGALEMKPNYKLMMVGSLEEDIKNVANKPFDTTEVLDDFEDIDHDSHIPLQKLQVSYQIILGGWGAHTGGRCCVP